MAKNTVYGESISKIAQAALEADVFDPENSGSSLSYKDRTDAWKWHVLTVRTKGRRGTIHYKDFEEILQRLGYTWKSFYHVLGKDLTYLNEDVEAVSKAVDQLDKANRERIVKLSNDLMPYAVRSILDEPTGDPKNRLIAYWTRTFTTDRRKEINQALKENGLQEIDFYRQHNTTMWDTELLPLHIRLFGLPYYWVLNVKPGHTVLCEFAETEVFMRNYIFCSDTCRAFLRAVLVRLLPSHIEPSILQNIRERP